MPPSILQCSDLDLADARALLAGYGLTLCTVREGATIPGSYWGEPEAGLCGAQVWVRPDTPVHSLLHETAHVICMDPDRRSRLQRDAGGDDLEESAVCYLQLVLADALRDVGIDRIAADMDRWGYSFRLGSTLAWHTHDAADARRWLERHGLIDAHGPTGRLRPGDAVSAALTTTAPSGEGG